MVGINWNDAQRDIQREVSKVWPPELISDINDFALDLISEKFIVRVKPPSTSTYYNLDLAIDIYKLKGVDRNRDAYLLSSYSMEYYKEIQEILSIFCDRVEDRANMHLVEFQVNLSYSTIQDLILKTNEIPECDELEEEIFSHTKFVKRVPGKKASMLEDKCIQKITLWFKKNDIIKKFADIE